MIRKGDKVKIISNLYKPFNAQYKEYQELIGKTEEVTFRSDDGIAFFVRFSDKKRDYSFGRKQLIKLEEA